ncbi:MAG TPA: aldolase/citrate lyase family protein, partial [Candidatus Saccharimonadales bacterium]|nr:aldolase/citrate lyase family protein [Candidatus Saccharimonadales bacterium]
MVRIPRLHAVNIALHGGNAYHYRWQHPSKMKVAAIKKLRQKLAAGDSIYGMWVTLESASISEMAVALGLDWIVIDAEHGHLDCKAILEHVRATVRSDTVALVRTAELNGALIKRVLDIGADGVVVPWIETTTQLKQALSFACYPPEGVRGIGGERATGWGQCFLQHTQEANEHVLVVPIIESVLGGENVKSLADVPGTDIFFIGPADYSSSAGHRGQWEGPGVASALLAIKDTIRASGKHCGVIATSIEDLVQRRQQGFRMLGLGADAGLLLRSLHGALARVGRDRRIMPTFIPEPTVLPATPRPRPPEAFRPDRGEVMNACGKNSPVELAPGVMLDALVGAGNKARNLTTGIVTFAPKARLLYHTHVVSESITVLSGNAIVGVEGREYALGPLDNIVIPRGLSHSAWNASSSEPGRVHVALASETPGRELVPEPATNQKMDLKSTGVPGKERVTRIATAPRTEAGPGTTFIDHFN